METITRKLRIAAQGLGAAALLATGTSVLAQTSATIPAGMYGTYELEFQPASGAPALLPAGEKLDLVLAEGGTSCIADYVLVNPTLSSGNSVEAFYVVPSLGIKLALSDISSGQFNEINVLSMSDQFLGQFSSTGPKKSNSTTCPLIGTAQADLGDISRIIDLAEQQFADLFPTAGANNAFQVIDGFIARTYTTSGISVGIKNGTVYVAGGEFGDQPQTIGTIANTLAQLTGGTTIDEPVVEVPEGDYNLTISGTVTSTVMGISTSTPLELTINDIPAPDSSDIDKLEDDIRESLKEVNGIDSLAIASFKVSEISSSSNGISFRVEFAGTLVSSGMTINMGYNLVYKYVKQ